MARYDTARRRWRHLDFGACQAWLEADIHRIDCRSCSRVRTEQVPWARPNARHTTDFENVAAWLAQRMDKASIARLLRCSWEAVDAIVTRVVADHIDDRRLDQLYRIGVDEISYKRGHKFLTIVADHDTGNVVWVGKERRRTDPSPPMIAMPGCAARRRPRPPSRLAGTTTRPGDSFATRPEGHGPALRRRRRTPGRTS